MDQAEQSVPNLIEETGRAEQRSSQGDEMGRARHTPVGKIRAEQQPRELNGQQPLENHLNVDEEGIGKVTGRAEQSGSRESQELSELRDQAEQKGCRNRHQEGQQGEHDLGKALVN